MRKSGTGDESTDDDENEVLLDGSEPMNSLGVCITCVPSGSVAVVQQFGRFKGYVEPGLACFCPPFTSLREVSLAVVQLDCQTECKTRDNVTLTVATAVQYRINKAMIKQAVFDIVDPQAQIRALVDDVLRSTLPTMDLDSAYSAKDQVCQAMVRSVKNSMAVYGFDVINILITDLRPEPSVLQAMNAINASRRQREAALEQGEAQKILMVKAAEADSEAKFLQGQGVARMRTAIADGFKESMETMASGGLSPQDAMHMMITTQYIDTMKDFATSTNSTAVMVPHGPGAVKEIEAQVRDGFLSASSMKPPQQAMR
mmetsp:Transcript_131576/g.281328  ORF Transcript_131576/g.281328 Transcript_131576/m.281328 type:complete len:315 (-) Transcript_131576:88-1032(-)